MSERTKLNATELSNNIFVRPDDYQQDKFNLYRSLAVPSYVHSYSLCIEYYYNWFKKHFADNYFRGGVYIDGKHVLDEYKQSDITTIKRENPRARIVPTLDSDYDRDDLDNYLASPEVYLRRSRFQDSFFKDYENKMFLSLQMKALRMNFNAKIRVNTRAEQLDLWNYMQLNFRNGATQYEYLSIDFHVPKSIIINIAERAGFEIINDEIKDILEFLSYFNKHSDLTLLFKIRAINKKPEFFIRVNDIYTHISCKDKISRDDGERDGKLDSNFHVEMENIVTMPIPAFYAFSDQCEIKVPIETTEMNEGMIALYSINMYDIPPVNERGWGQAAVTYYQTDKDDLYMDLSSLFEGENILARTINHTMAKGVSPSSFIDIKVYKGQDKAKLVPINMNWKNKTALFKNPADNDTLQIVVYYDREYINLVDSELNKYNDSRVSIYKNHNSKTN
jgi:hypothetical protein